MICWICKHGETSPGKVTVTLQRKNTTVIIKELTTDVCENCGEYYLNEQVTENILRLAEEAVKHYAEVEVLRYAA